jgi:hypothetical protein
LNAIVTVEGQHEHVAFLHGKWHLPFPGPWPGRRQ